MKNLAYVSLALFMMIALIQGCEKTQNVKPTELIATKTTVKFNEVDTLTLPGADNDSIKWTVTPSGLNGIHKINNKALIVFLKAGKYTVSAATNGGTPLTKVITVLDVDFNPPAPPKPVVPTYTNVPITDENIVITPHYYKMLTSDSTYFTLSAQTSKTYPCGNSEIATAHSQINNNYVINLSNIIQPDGTGCTLPNTQLKPNLFSFYPTAASPYTFGTVYPLTITVGSATYSGVITFNQTYMDIVWNYTSGVTMTSKHIAL